MNIKKFILLLLFLSLPVGLLGLDKEPKKKNAKVEDNEDNYKITFAKKVRNIIKMGGDLNVCNENEAVPLLIRAMYNKDIELFREMLQTNNIDVNSRYYEIGDHIPLIIACMSDDNESEFIQLLLDHGANINQKSHLTPLMWVASKSNKENLKVLLQNKVNINDTKSNGLTALMYACKESYPGPDYELIQILLSHGANPNMQTGIYDHENKTTALMFLAKSHRSYHTIEEEEKLVKIARLLIFSGADPEIIDGNGKTFLDYAKKESFKAKLEMVCKEYKKHLKQCLKSSDTYNITHFPNPISDIIANYVL